ncbi:MAG: hypothetical protein GVY20_13895 [Bacteroidetes bacterium]|jgi:cell division septation protein DedD|nr:hypothetical protein [Bacteroidota bacterium]
MTYTIENKHSAVVLGTFQAETEAEALDQMAKEAGYTSFNEIPNANKDELLIQGHE